MNNILYISLNNKESYISSSICYQILNQTKKSYLLSVFDSINEKDLVYNYFLQYTSTLYFINTIETKSTVDQIISGYPKYNWFAFLCPYNLYDREFTEEIYAKIDNAVHDEMVVCPHNQEKIPTNCSLIVNKQKLMEYRAEKNLRYLLNLKKNDDSVYNFYSYKSVAYPVEVTENYCKTQYYSDDFCIFAKFSSFRDLLESFVYINRRNNRVYNIVNNTVGYLVYAEDNKNLKIRWQKSEEEFLDTEYYLDPIRQEYISI